MGKRDFLLTPLIPGDINRDLVLDGRDIPAMLSALSDLQAYKTSHQLSDSNLLAIADTNFDGKITNADLNALLKSLKSAPVPEPSTALLASMGIVIFALLRFGRKKV